MSYPIKYLAVLLLLGLVACTDSIGDGLATLSVILDAGGGMTTKAKDPEEGKIGDINILVFNHEGKLEERIYRNSRAVSSMKDKGRVELSLIRNLKYSVFACVNFGYQITGIESLNDIEEYRYYLAYPDEYKSGIPMVGQVKGVIAGSRDEIEIGLERLMSKVSLSIDRSRLDPEVKFSVRSVQIGNCPRSVRLYGSSKAENNRDVFGQGFFKSYSEVDGLNREKSVGISEEVAVYMLENMQGNLLPGGSSDQDKILSDSGLAEVCSYLEIKAEYSSSEYASRTDEYLVYRFYLGGGKGNFDIERNCHYHFTIRPEGDGLNEDSWRVDKSGLSRKGSASFTISPGQYIEGLVGESVHIRATVSPPDGYFEISLEDLEYDRSRGIYDFELDEDGKGVLLDLKKRGSGLFQLQAGNPVSASEIVAVVVN